MSFSLQDVDGVIDRTGLPFPGNKQALAEDLDEAWGTYLVMRGWDASSSPGPLAKKLENVEKAAARLLKHPGMSGDAGPAEGSADVLKALARAANIYAERHGEYRDFPMETFTINGEQGQDWRGELAVHKAVDYLLLLHAWAGTARALAQTRAQNQMLPSIEGLEDLTGPDATALSWLVGDKLPELYKAHFQRRFGVSKPGGRTDRLNDDARVRGEHYGPGIRFVQSCLEVIGIAMRPDAVAQHWKRYRHRYVKQGDKRRRK